MSKRQLSSTLASAALACTALMLAACSGGEEKQAAAPAQINGFVAETMGEGTIANADGALTFTRDGSGNQGITLLQEPVLVTFTAEGEGARVRVRQGRTWIDLEPADQYSVMIGRGGAGQVRVFSRRAETLNVRVISVVGCSTGQATCQPLPEPAAEQEAEASEE